MHRWDGKYNHSNALVTESLANLVHSTQMLDFSGLIVFGTVAHYNSTGSTKTRYVTILLHNITLCHTICCFQFLSVTICSWMWTSERGQTKNTESRFLTAQILPQFQILAVWWMLKFHPFFICDARNNNNNNKNTCHSKGGRSDCRMCSISCIET